MTPNSSLQVDGAQSGSTRAAPVLSEAIVRQYARRLARAADTGKVLALRGDPAASLPEVIEVGDGQQVRVRACPSSLAVRAALLDQDPQELLIIITDRPKSDLGLTLLSQFRQQDVQLADSWASVAQLFDASRVDRVLRQAGPVVADALLTHAPAKGYPAAPMGVVTQGMAIAVLAERVLGLDTQSLSPAGLLLWTRDSGARTQWRAADPTVRAAITDWVVQESGPVAGVALDVGGSVGRVDAVTIGLAADVLWPAAGAVPVEALAARTRAEPMVGGKALPDDVARQLADSARAVLLRMAEAGDPARASLLTRTQELLGDLGWPEGALRSSVLPAGYLARLRALADALADALTGSSGKAGPSGKAGATGRGTSSGKAARSGKAAPSGKKIEDALVSLLGHESAQRESRRDTECAQNAVRLSRWLSLAEDPPAIDLASALARHMDTDAWVDRAVADVVAGSNDPQVAEAYAGLCDRVAQRRRTHDLHFAHLLGAATTRTSDADGVVMVEDLLGEVVGPLSRTRPVLLVVVDGMSAAVASELADDAAALGWQEMVADTDQRRLAVLAALPSMTTYSRTSLLVGSLLAGTQAEEKRLFPKVAVGGPVFHKDDLRGAPGQALPDPVRHAIDGKAPVVAVVLNTVDDTLAKHDPDGTVWDVAAVQHLHSLLAQAAAAERDVVLTSDHGHVVERGGAARPVAGADNRWRPADSGVVAADEVLLAGPRVLAPGGQVVVPAVADLRYGRKSAGYHGGATPAEVAIPVVVLSRDPAGLAPAGWTPAPPQAPAWWHDGSAHAGAESGLPGVGSEPGSAVGVGSGGGSGKRARVKPPRQSEALFEPPAEPTKTEPQPEEPGTGASDRSVVSGGAAADGAGSGGRTGDHPSRGVAERVLAEQVLTSAVYAEQRLRAGRAALPDSTVAAVLAVLVAGQGRAHRDTVAAAARIPTSRFWNTMVMLRRLLNVEGFPVISLDADDSTVVLDRSLLSSQFSVSGP